MTLGPLEYILIGFEGNRFTGQILPELRAARDKGIIRVIDLLLILKDEQGNTAVMELSDLSSEELEQLGPIAGDLLEVLEQDDVEAIASNIPNNSSAALLLIEQTWAVGLNGCWRNTACRRAGCTGCGANVGGRTRSGSC